MAKEDRNTAIYIAYDDHEPTDAALAEKNLLRALLVTAMADLRKSGEVARRAHEYFLNPDESYIFSFISVCNHLNVDPHRVLMVTGLEKSKFPEKQVALDEEIDLEDLKR